MQSPAEAKRAAYETAKAALDAKNAAAEEYAALSAAFFGQGAAPARAPLITAQTLVANWPVVAAVVAGLGFLIFEGPNLLPQGFFAWHKQQADTGTAVAQNQLTSEQAKYAVQLAKAQAEKAQADADAAKAEACKREIDAAASAQSVNQFLSGNNQVPAGCENYVPTKVDEWKAPWVRVALQRSQHYVPKTGSITLGTPYDPSIVYTGDAFKDGQATRHNFESWFHSLSGDALSGALANGNRQYDNLSLNDMIKLLHPANEAAFIDGYFIYMNQSTLIKVERNEFKKFDDGYNSGDGNSAN